MDEQAWEVRVVAAGKNAAAAFARTHRFEVGPALSFDREEKSITSLEYVLGAIGADLVTNLQRAARKRRISVDSIEATVRATLGNPLTFIGVVGETGDPGMNSVRVRVYVTTLQLPESVEPAWQEALATSPLVNTLRNALKLELTLKTVV